MHNSKSISAKQRGKIDIMVMYISYVLYNMHKSILSYADCTMTIMLISLDTVTRAYCFTVSLAVYRVTFLLFHISTVAPSFASLSACLRLPARAPHQCHHPTPIIPYFRPPGAFLGHSCAPA